MFPHYVCQSAMLLLYFKALT